MFLRVDIMLKGGGVQNLGDSEKKETPLVGIVQQKL